MARARVEIHQRPTALGVVGTKDPPIDADKALYRDSTAGDALVTSTWAQVKAFLKTYFDTVYSSIAALAAHIANTAAGIHGSTVAATANRLIHRDAAGRSQIANPAANPDIDNMGSRNAAIAIEAVARAAADAAEAAARAAADAAHAAQTAMGIHGSAVLATPNLLVHRDAAGRSQIANPAANPDIDNMGSRNIAIAAEAAARTAADVAEAAARVAADAAEAAARAAADAAHAALTTGVHGVGAGTIAEVADIAVDGNLSAAAQAAIAAAHAQGTDTALGAVGTKNPPINADKVLYRDSTAGDALVTSTWTQVKAFLKTYFDTVYDAIGSAAAALAAALAALAAHVAITAAGIHGSSVAAAINTLVHRDAAGRSQIANPAANPDIDNMGSRAAADAAEAAARAAADAAHAALTTGVHGAGVNTLWHGGLTNIIDKTHLSQDFGPSSARLLNIILTPVADAILQINNTRTGPFTALINGAPTATSVVYDGEANESFWNGLQAGAGYWGRIILHNTTRGNSRKVVSVNLGTNTITTESSTDDWANNDVLTTQSQTNAFVGMFDVDLSISVPATWVAILISGKFVDNSGAGGGTTRDAWWHPYEAIDYGKLSVVGAYAANSGQVSQFWVPIIDQKMCMHFRNSTDVHIWSVVAGHAEYADT